MDGFISLMTWTPDAGLSDSIFSFNFLIIAVMSFIGAGVVTRLVNANTSFNFSINYAVMLAGCLLINTYVGDLLFAMPNELVASAVTANFGMTLAGFALLFGYRNAD